MQTTAQAPVDDVTMRGVKGIIELAPALENIQLVCQTFIYKNPRF